MPFSLLPVRGSSGRLSGRPGERDRGKMDRQRAAGVPGPDADHRGTAPAAGSREYVEHYNLHRSRRTLGQRPPAGWARPPAMSTNVQVLWRDRLGGLIHEYAQVA